MVPQFVEYLVHLERGGNGLDQRGGADGAGGKAEFLLRHHEDVVPEPRLKMALHFGEIKVWPRPPFRKSPAVMEHEQAEIEEGGGDRRAVDRDMLFLHVPPARTDHDRRVI